MMDTQTLVDRILTEMEEAVEMFGTYQFLDKGAGEVMDLDGLLEALRALPAEQMADVLEAVVAKQSPHGALKLRLVSDLLSDLQDVEDADWEVLMSREALSELVE
jgi:hypothetical protein